MLRKLSRERRKVEQLATLARLGQCSEQHRRTQIVFEFRDDPVPEWPEAGADERCACGATLQYVRIVNRIRQ